VLVLVLGLDLVLLAEVLLGPVLMPVMILVLVLVSGLGLGSWE
jgi:hypothetical protein